MKSEFKKRDNSLDILESTRGAIIVIAKGVAEKLAKLNGTVTAGDVLKNMKQFKALDDELKKIDPRFMGCVFRDRKKWKRVGYDNTGSHGRPVSVWKMAA